MYRAIFSIIAALLFLNGCKVIEYVDRPVIVERVTVQRDTVTNIQRDSVVFYQNGDTVRIEKWKTIFKDRLSFRVDSVPVIKTVIKEVQKEVVKVKYKHDGFWWLGVISLFLFAGFVIWKIYRKLAP